MIDLKAICEVLGAHVEVVDPFDVAATIETLLRLLQDEKGVKVLILKRECALVSAKHQKRLYQVEVDQERCLGETCGCNRLCTRIFKCPGLMWDKGLERPVLTKPSARVAGSVLRSVLPRRSGRRRLRCSSQKIPSMSSLVESAGREMFWLRRFWVRCSSPRDMSSPLERLMALHNAGAQS